MAKQLTEEEIYKQTAVLVKLFLDNNYSDLDFEKIEGLNVSSSTVQRRLTNKDVIVQVFDNPNNYMAQYPNTTDLPYGNFIYETVKARREQNLINARKKGGNISQMNNMQIKDSEGKYIGNVPNIQLSRIYRKPRNQAKFLLHVIYTFKLQLSTVAEIFSMSEDEIMNIIREYEGYDFEQFNLCVNTFYDRSQKRAKLKFLKLYSDLLGAIKENNTDRFHEVMSIVDDSNYKAVKAKKKNNEPLHSEDIIVIIKHQIKYLASQQAIADDLDCNRGNLSKRYERVLAQNPELNRDYRELSEFYYGRFNGSYRR